MNDDTFQSVVKSFLHFRFFLQKNMQSYQILHNCPKTARTSFFGWQKANVVKRTFAQKEETYL